jgi:ribonuclease D
VTIEPITRPEPLAALAERLATAPRIALDTEFVRERTYAAELALVQIASTTEIALVDPLAQVPKEALSGLLGHAAQVKVLHAARQDIEVLLPLTGAPLAPLLDTQIAAALCGYAPQIGYGELVGRELGHTLEKGHARTDWTRRPLSAAQLAYAADDVRWLLPLAEGLEAKLDTLGRSAWLAEDLQRLLDPAIYRLDPLDAWQRFKGIETLPVAEQVRLRALAAWRETRAQRRNLPRGWVLADEVARTLARQPPTTLDQLSALDVLPSSTVEKLGSELVECLAGAADTPTTGLEQRDSTRPSDAERQRQQRLTQQLRALATELRIAPEVLATQKDLRRIAAGETVEAVFRGWRRTVVGERVGGG